jgi:hypothetical protein
MKANDRVLGENGFESFPERFKEEAIKQGNLAESPDEGDACASDLKEHGVKGKAEISKKQAEAAKAQKEADDQKKLDLLKKVASI